jgi:hypothetical protein
MDWREANRVDSVLGLAGNGVLHSHVRTLADDLCVRRAQGLSSGAGADEHRTRSEVRYGAKSGARQRRVVARLEASALGLDPRYVVTTLAEPAKHLDETTYCGRGQAENLIKLHKTQLASDRTSCQSPRANQFRLVLHTAACWLMHGVRAAIPKASPFAKAEFATLRLRPVKLAARVVETASRIRVRLPSASPDRAPFRQIAIRLAAQPP